MDQRFCHLSPCLLANLPSIYPPTAFWTFDDDLLMDICNDYCTRGTHATQEDFLKKFNSTICLFSSPFDLNDFPGLSATEKVGKRQGDGGFAGGPGSVHVILLLIHISYYTLVMPFIMIWWYYRVCSVLGAIELLFRHLSDLPGTGPSAGSHGPVLAVESTGIAGAIFEYF
ncbi:hypothetical protein B0H21DRAFT_710730 [Amylocystis lapponica]|nr:hypothetical protein B0H21DRAFT_710730 [Amylocystis lapponica]